MKKFYFLRNERLFSGVLAAAFSFLLLVSSSEISLALGDPGAPHVMKRGIYRLPAGSEAGDVVVSGGPVEIRGKVRGSIFVEDGSVTILNTGSVAGNVTVIGADLRLMTGSHIVGSVYVIGGDLKRQEGAIVDGQVTVTEKEPSLETRILLGKYLVFERPCPPEGTPSEILDRMIRDLFIREQIAKSAWNSIEIPGLPSLALADKVSPGATLASWTDWKWNFRVGVARIPDAKSSSKIWDAILQTWDEDKVRRSVQVSLGNGAHWFFDVGDSSVAVWISDTCLIMVAVSPAEGKKVSGDFAEMLRDNLLIRMVFSWTKRLR